MFDKRSVPTLQKCIRLDRVTEMSSVPNWMQLAKCCHTIETLCR